MIGRVYVDRMFRTKPTRRWPFTSACHLFADSLDDLHRVAASIGMRPQWAQLHSILPHYDLTESKREQAIVMGCISISREFLVDMIAKTRQPGLGHKAHHVCDGDTNQ